VHPVRVLVVDDDPDLRAFVRLALEAAGYDVEVAANGREALQFFADNPPDVVVTDIFMPEMDGFELIMKLKGYEPRVPIIAISGGGRFRDPSIARPAIALGAVEMLVKPFDRSAIVAAVRRAQSAR
jgi:two-component system response regulator AtoC